MRTLAGHDALKSFGIDVLTGEACAYGMRLLCDFTEDGAALLRDYFSLGDGDNSQIFNRNWNLTINGKDAIGSIMLDRSVFPSLVRFAMFREGYDYVVEQGQAYNAFNREHDKAKGGSYDLSRYICTPTGERAEDGSIVYRNPHNALAYVDIIYP